MHSMSSLTAMFLALATLFYESSAILRLRLNATFKLLLEAGLKCMSWLCAWCIKGMPYGGCWEHEA
ncbi:MAG: hypothetical protein DRN96_08000 [Thermoproteota archaeon]|nr:MAG: hypothetical protein DRN96_08000 [Candidatus Korarchaeota archaeon]RLG54411.1 MAG: hypothetical protein DRN99_05115 [Candidatus Korarchaeota archaeon]